MDGMSTPLGPLRQRGGDKFAERAALLMADTARRVVAEKSQPGGCIDSKQRFYNYRLDETELTAIRRAVCEAIEEAG